MTPQEIVPYYKKRIADTKAALEQIKNRISRIALLRLLVFAAGIAAAFFLHTYGWQTVLISLGAALIPFLLLIKVHEGVFRQKTFTQNLLRVLDDEHARLKGVPVQTDNGAAYRQDEHPYSDDLDLLGPDSLYAELNRCGTLRGRQRLAQWLLQGARPDEIQARQEAVLELQAKNTWREAYMAEGRSTADTEADLTLLTEWLQEPDYFRPRKGLWVAVNAVPVLVALALVGYLAGYYSWLQLGYAFLPGLFLMSMYTKYISGQHERAGEKYKLLLKYAGLLDCLAGEEFTATRMVHLKARVTGDTGAAAGLRKLARMLEILDSRPNLIATLLTNSLYARDVRIGFELENWKHQYRDKAPRWLDVLAETDALVSLGTFAFNYPDLNMPHVSADGPLLQAKELGHPFIPAERRIGNDAQLNDWGQILLITGSNMAGKSTFLRAAGINIVLAQAGAPVCAAQLRMRPIPLYTSMRIGDSVRDSESTFYAELKRLKTILQILQRGEPLFILLDEILRGTNSADKLTGSFALLRQLLGLPAAGLVATHDLQLARLAEEYPGRLHNYNFEVQIVDDRFRFDYKLRPGVCRTLNATQLMRQMGINIQ